MKTKKINIWLILLFHLVSIQSNAQHNTIIKGNIFNEEGKPVAGTIIKISSLQKDAIIFYKIFGQETNYYAALKIALPDTIMIHASNPGHGTATYKLPVLENAEYSIDLTLQQKSDTLENIVIKAPPVWKRGDTTFFNVESFKRFSDKKLADIIGKMPGFEIDAEGNLFYNRQLVSKILVEGQELFADKLKMMLSNFPIHVLQTVQTIENQSDNNLLKGLSGDKKIFLNLSLKKSKLKAAFGDGEIGLGTEGRYYFNPVIFSLLNKVKVAVIGNINSVGKGLNWNEEMEIKPLFIRTSEQAMMNPDLLRRINNFPAEDYIINRQFDTRAAINYNLGKKIAAKTEVTWLRDRQRQNTYQHLSLYNSQFFFNRNDTSLIVQRPDHKLIKQSIDIIFDSLLVLKSSLLFYHQTTNNNQDISFYQENEYSYSSNRMNDNSSGGELSLELTKRISSTKAIRINAILSRFNLHQDASGISPSWGEIYNVDELYNTVNHTMRNKGYLFSTGIDYLFKTRAGTTKIGLESFRKSFDYTSISLLSNQQNAITPYLLSTFSNNVNYNVNRINGVLQNQVKFLNLPISVKAYFGLDNSQVLENSKRSSYTKPFIQFELNQKSNLSKNLSSWITAGYTQQMVQPNQLLSMFYPAGINNYRKYSNNTIPLKNIYGQAMLTYVWGKNLNATSVLFHYNKSLSTFIPLISYVEFVQILNDSLTDRQSDYLSININSSHPLQKLKTLIHFGGSISRMESILPVNHNFFRADLIFTNAFFRFEKNWNKKYYVTGDLRYEINYFHAPREIATMVEEKTSNFKFTLSPKLEIKSFQFILQNQYFLNNISSQNQADFVLLDMEVHYRPAGKNLSFFLKGKNLLNEENFYSFNNSLQMQNFYTIPLVRRNLLAGMRMEF